MSSNNSIKALLFDCDGVLVDTERDGHRVAFNCAFEQLGINANWDIPCYGRLLQISGGKERMRHYFDANGWPEEAINHSALIQELHELKTNYFMRMIEEGELPLRPGVARLIDEAIQSGISLGVCSTSNERAVNSIITHLLGRSRNNHFRVILAGDVVSRKKPDPEIYLLACQILGFDGKHCVVIEDSRNGLLAAKGANMRCVITKSSYTCGEDFHEADLLADSLGEHPGEHVSLSDLAQLIHD